ncbi:AI-2E family transporter [Dokdonia donghaensis]|uniref:Transmembrane protein n=1 Tax=Dokdonia donghaensis DSW-1 TaxID=1300343 RepID=A0A0A2GQU9_9FLAO|nr:AI-2E family transporter [Dokdonia donghaensis]ANH61204.1 putative inner membrane protein [Dokdonia donghaensis DSW-1]KGO05592.1 transmembrane protein [Dokdonia donghaensis DSW-1]
MQTLKPNLLRQFFIIFLIILFGWLIFKEMATYLSGILGAITLFVLLRKWQEYLVKKRKWNSSVSACVLMAGSFLVILVPIAGLVLMLTSKISKAVENSGKVINIVKTEMADIESRFGLDIASSIDTSSVTDWISSNLQGLAGGTFNVFIAIGLMYFMLYYMLTNRRTFRESMLEYIPLSEKNLKLIGKDSQELVKSNAIGIPLVALLQGLVALIGFLILGVEDPFFWFAIVTVGSMIPFVGTALGIVPVCIILYAAGDIWQAIVMVIYGTVVVGSTDNLFRLVIQKRLADVHPLITIIGVIVGVPLFGFIGLIFGPIVVSIFLLIVKIYKQEYGKEVPSKQEGVL